jgi:HK97 family phage portal protein
MMLNPIALLGRAAGYIRKELRSGLQYYDPQEQAWTPRILELAPTRSGVAINEVTAMKCLDVFACIRCIAEDIAKLPLYLYKRTGDRGKERVLNHVADLLNKQPNPEMTAFDFKTALQGHVLSWGNAFAEIEFTNSGQPYALWPLPPDRMKVLRNKAREIVYEFRPNYIDQPTLLPAWKVLHIKGLGFDGLVGYSPIRVAAENIGVDMAQKIGRASCRERVYMPV